MHTSEEDSEGAQCAALCGDTYGFTKVALVQDLYIAPEKNALGIYLTIPNSKFLQILFSIHTTPIMRIAGNWWPPLAIWKLLNL